MKTLQIAGNSKVGGGTYLLIEWCRFLVKKGWKIDVLTSDSQTTELIKKIDGVTIIDNIYISREIHLYQDVLALFKLIYLLRSKKYDVVHTYSATPSVIGRWAAKFAGNKKIYHHQAGWTIDESSSGLVKMIYRAIERSTSYISTKSICVGEGVAQEARNYRLIPESKIKIIHNGINPTPFVTRDSDPKIIRELFSLPIDALIICCTSRLSNQKDVSSLVQAFTLLPSKVNERELALVIAGDGEERQNLINYTVDHHINNRVYFLGFVSDIPSLLSCIDIYVSPTLREGLSISILEAMAAAKPIITTNILANREIIINNKTGLLVPVKSAMKIAEAIQFLIENQKIALEYGKNAQNLVLNHYTIDRMFRETYELYSEI